MAQTRRRLSFSAVTTAELERSIESIKEKHPSLMRKLELYRARRKMYDQRQDGADEGVPSREGMALERAGGRSWRSLP